MKFSVNSKTYTFKNYFLFFLHFFIKGYYYLFVKRKTKKDTKAILFFNNGQIGDLLVSSIILENEDLLPNNISYYFLISDDYKSIFSNYKGNIKFLTYNINKYRKSPFYRIKLLKMLDEINFVSTYNICAARGILTEEIACLSGASNLFCLNKTSIYLDKFLINYFNKKYKKLYSATDENEYLKTLHFIEHVLCNDSFSSVKFSNKKVYNFAVSTENYIAIAPFTSDISRNWGLNKYIELINFISKTNKVVLLGSNNEANLLNNSLINLHNINNLIGKTSFYQAAEYINNCIMFIGNDSGLTHLALKLNKPIVAIIGGGMWGRFFPFNQSETKLFLNNDIGCNGCHWNCIHEVKYCLTDLSIKTVIKNINTLLKSL